MFSLFFLLTGLLAICHHTSASLNQMPDTNTTLHDNGQSVHSKSLEPEGAVWSSAFGVQSESTNQAGRSNTAAYSWSPIDASQLIKKPAGVSKITHLPIQLPNSMLENRLQLQDFLSKIQQTNDQTDMHNFKTNLLKDRLYDCNLLPKIASYEPHEEVGDQKLNIYDYQLYDLDRAEQQIDEKPKHFANFIYYDEPPRANYLNLNPMQLGSKKDGLEAESVMRHWKSTTSPTLCHELDDCYGGVVGNSDPSNHAATKTDVNKQLLEMFHRHYFASSPEETEDWSEPVKDLLQFSHHNSNAKRHHMFDMDDDTYFSYNTHIRPYQGRKHYSDRRSSKHRREPISKRRLLHRASISASGDNMRSNANHQRHNQSGESKKAPINILPWSSSAEPKRVNSLSAWGTTHPSQTLSRLKWPKPVLVIKEYEEYNE